MNKIDIKRTNASDQDFISLVKELDAFLKVSDGDEHDFYDQYNHLDDIKYVVLVYINGKAVACGAIKAFDSDTMEIKRMYTKSSHRGQGLATAVLKELEKWATELHYSKCILETGTRQTEAIHLYQKNNYTIIPNYGQYADVENSVCFEKAL